MAHAHQITSFPSAGHVWAYQIDFPARLRFLRRRDGIPSLIDKSIDRARRGEHSARNAPTRGTMKALALLLVALSLFCGCAQRYKITLHNRQVMTTNSRPKFDEATGTYRFKNDMGQEVVLPGFRVKEIEPL